MAKGPGGAAKPGREGRLARSCAIDLRIACFPSATAVLIILITTILGAGAKKKALYAGLAFSLSIFIFNSFPFKISSAVFT